MRADKDVGKVMANLHQEPDQEMNEEEKVLKPKTLYFRKEYGNYTK